MAALFGSVSGWMELGDMAEDEFRENATRMIDAGFACTVDPTDRTIHFALGDGVGESTTDLERFAEVLRLLSNHARIVDADQGLEIVERRAEVISLTT